jgi:hypothetical protein
MATARANRHINALNRAHLRPTMTQISEGHQSGPSVPFSYVTSRMKERYHSIFSTLLLRSSRRT